MPRKAEQQQTLSDRATTFNPRSLVALLTFLTEHARLIYRPKEAAAERVKPFKPASPMKRATAAQAGEISGTISGRYAYILVDTNLDGPLLTSA